MPEQFAYQDYSLKKRQYRHRRMFAQQGEASGVDPSLVWPTREQLAEIKEIELKFEPTLQERWAKLNAAIQEDLEERQMKQELVEKQMAKMPELIAQFKGKLAKADVAETKQEQKRKTLMEEARDYFGYYIDPRDPRFKQMQELKAEEELKLKKKKKKEEKVLRVQSAMKRMKEEIENQQETDAKANS